MLLLDIYMSIYIYFQTSDDHLCVILVEFDVFETPMFKVVKNIVSKSIKINYVCVKFLNRK